MEQSQFDGILFHERNINTRDLPTKDQRRPDQIYVHYTLESPFWSQDAFTGSFQNYFNMTISYRNDANIKSEFYGSVMNIKQLETIKSTFGEWLKNKDGPEVVEQLSQLKDPAIKVKEACSTMLDKLQKVHN